MIPFFIYCKFILLVFDNLKRFFLAQKCKFHFRRCFIFIKPNLGEKVEKPVGNKVTLNEKVCHCSVAKSCPTLWPHGLQLTRLPCPYDLSERAQTHVHRVSDAIQPSHPLSSPSPPTFNLSQHQSFFQWMSQLFASGSQSIGASASALLVNTQGWFPLGLTGLISVLSKGLSRVFSHTTIRKHQFFNTLILV